jgi:rare lipoprotein A
MSLRFGAALCGAAFMLFYSHGAIANQAKRDAEKGNCSCSSTRLRSKISTACARPSRQGNCASASRGRSQARVAVIRLRAEPAGRDGAAIVGKASTYNPLRPDDSTAGGLETASGEAYNSNDWTAAIQSALRGIFGGIGFGKAYRPAYALVEVGNKRAVVKINDVGPLKPGRVIDLNERAMRYFDPSMKLGLLAVRITPLTGNRVLGPITGKLAS